MAVENVTVTLKQSGTLLKACNRHSVKQLHVGVSVLEKRKFIPHTKPTMGTVTVAFLVIVEKLETSRCPPWVDGEHPGVSVSATQ